jgi:hypothetical protein
MLDERPRRGRVAVEHVAGAAAVDDHLPAEVPDLGQVRVAAQMTRASVRATRSVTTVGIQPWSKPAVWEPGDAWHHEDQRVVARTGARRAACAASRGARRPSSSWAHSARAHLLRDAVLVPREGGGVVEVGDGDVRVALDDERAVRLQRRAPASTSRRLRAVEDQVAGDEDGVRLGGADLGGPPRGRRRCRGCRTGRRAGSSQHSLGRDDERGVASQATSPSTLATAAPRPKRCRASPW